MSHPTPAAAPPLTPTPPAIDVETAKRNAARLAVRDHFPPSAAYIGIGSGTTIIYVLEAIVALDRDTSRIRFVPTGYQSRQNILKYGLTPIAFDSLPDDALLDVAFDGADEIDEDLNCIKGGGACLYQEKLVAMRARKFVCVAGRIHLPTMIVRTRPIPIPVTPARLTREDHAPDHRKLQTRLLTHWPTIPIEVNPLALSPVLAALRALGSPAPTLRTGHMDKAGPLKTDQANFIVDAPFPTLLAQKPSSTQPPTPAFAVPDPWDPAALARAIKLIEGVLSVGLFVGENGDEAAAAGRKSGGQKPVAAYFGMADGGVVVRRGSGDTRVEERR